MLFQNHKHAIVLLTAVILLSLSLIACSVSPSATVDSDDTPTSSAESEILEIPLKMWESRRFQSWLKGITLLLLISTKQFEMKMAIFSTRLIAFQQHWR